MTHNEFVITMQSVNPNIRVLGGFINLTTKIKVECLIDGRIWDAPPRKLLKGMGCRTCSTKKNGDTHVVTPKEYKERVNKANPSIELLSDYINARTKVTVKCLVDGYIWDAFPSTLYRGGCPKCAHRKLSETKTLSHDEYVDRLRVLNPNIEILGTYTGTRNKLEVKCIKHGTVWSIYPHNFLNGEGCSICKSEKLSARAETHEEFSAKLHAINSDIELLEEYKNSDTAILVRCKKHDTIWYSNRSRLLNGGGCRTCGIEKLTESNKLSTTEVEEKLRRINPNIELAGEYSGGKYKTRFKCLTCGNEWAAHFQNIISGCGCPACASSKGESAVRSALDERVIEYIQQYSFVNCKNSISLRFDFYLPSLNTVIEFQGEQHYKPVDFAGKGIEWATERFLYGQFTDKIKRDYCSENNITLIEIKYDEVGNIPEIIDGLCDSAQKAVSA